MTWRAAPALVAALLVLLVAVGARAETQSQALRRGEEAEQAFEFARAIAAYRAAEAIAPRSRLSRRAAQRIEYLEARKEGDFAPLAAFERQRRLREPTVADVEAFERRVESFPPGRVKNESRALIADTYLLRLEQPERAVHAYEAWLAEPRLDDADWTRATNGLALARARLGDLRGSLDTLKKAGLGAHTEATYVRLAIIRTWARPLSVVLIAAFVLLSFLLGGREKPARLARRLSPLWLATLFWVVGFPLLIASRHRPETWRTMLWLAPGATLLALVAMLTGPGLTRPYQRRLLSVLGTLAQLAVLYLSLEQAQALLGLVMSFRRG